MIVGIRCRRLGVGDEIAVRCHAVAEIEDRQLEVGNDAAHRLAVRRHTTIVAIVDIEAVRIEQRVRKEIRSKHEQQYDKVQQYSSTQTQTDERVSIATNAEKLVTLDKERTQRLQRR